MSQHVKNYGSCIMLNSEVTWWQGLKRLEHLDNGIKRVNQPVQIPFEMITDKGVRVTLQFSAKPNPQIRRDIASMLLAAFEKRSIS